MRSVGRAVHTRLCQIEKLLVLQGFTGGTIRNPVRMILVELLQPLQNHDENTKPGRDPRESADLCENRNKRRRRDRADFQNLKSLLVAFTLPVIPLDLVLQAIQGDVLYRRGSDANWVVVAHGKR